MIVINHLACDGHNCVSLNFIQFDDKDQFMEVIYDNNELDD